MRQPATQTSLAATLCLAVLSLIPTSAGAADGWQPTGPDGGTLLALAVGPETETLFVGTRSGVFRSTDDGASWVAANGGLPLSDPAGAIWVQALAVDAGPPETVYASVLLEGVFKSLDGGATWQEAGNGLVAGHAEQLVVHAGDPGTVYALTSAGVFRTTNGGAQWTSLPDFPTSAPHSATVIAVDPNASQTLYVGMPDQLLKTVNGGQTWTRIDGPGFRGWFVDEIEVDPDSPNTLYAAATDFTPEGTGLFRSDDGGVTWTRAEAGLPSGERILALALGPTAGELYAAPFGSGVFRSVDGGRHWSGLDGGLAHASALVPDPTPNDTLYAIGAPPGVSPGVTTGVFRTANHGESWQPRSRGIDAYELDAVIVDPEVPSTLYLRSLYEGILKTTDAGQTWRSVNDGLGEPGTHLGVEMLVIDPTDPRVLYASLSGKGFFKTVDGGLHWSPIATPGGTSLFGLATLSVDPQDSRILIAAIGRGVFRSIDAGKSWQRLGGELERLGQSGGDLHHFELVRDPSATQVIYASAIQEIVGSPPRAEGFLLRSVDRGATWSVVAEDFLYFLAIAPGPPSVLYAYAGHDILASVDGGVHWTTVGTTPHPIFRLLVDPRSAQTLFAASTFHGVLRSDDGGATWRPWNEGLANLVVTDLAFDPHDPSRLFLATRGGGLSTRLASTEPCVPSATVLCLGQGRFRVTVSWKDFSGRTGAGRTMELTDDTGAFWFFAAGNLELTVKVLDGRALNGRFWVFYGALTNVEFTLEVTDTETGRRQVYRNPSGRFASVGDTAAF
jgi:photosystem II stability/assembly factor-like uncharacterized protein